MQDGHMVAYEYQKLKDHKMNYEFYNIELVTVIHAVKMWRHYLIGNKFTLIIDHIILKYIFSQTDMNVKQAGGWRSQANKFLTSKK